VYNAGEVVSCGGCGEYIKGLKRFCRGCGDGIVCYACWTKSTAGCQCSERRKIPCCVQCADSEDVGGTPLSEQIFDTTVEALTDLKSACVEYVVEPAIVVSYFSAVVTWGLADNVLAGVIYPVQAVYSELSRTSA
jgi:hypothetical protein